MLWNAGACIAYVFSAGLALIACLGHFGGLGKSILISPHATFEQEFALSVIALVLSIVACVLNLMYAQNYFRHSRPRSRISMAATIGFLVLVGFQACRSVSGVATYFNMNRSYNVSDGIVTILNIVVWGTLIFDIINALLGTLAFWFVFKGSEAADKQNLIVRVDGKVEEEKEKTGIAAEVADHAMGHPKPSPEALDEVGMNKAPSQELNDPIDSPVKKPAEEEPKKEEEKKEKEVPPVLSANPDNDLLGKINREERVLKMDLPTFAAPDEVRKSVADHQGSALPSAPTHTPASTEKKPEPKPAADFEDDTLPVDKSED